MANIVKGSVGLISAPKYRVSKNVNVKLPLFGINCTQPYIKAPIRNADNVVPTIAYSKIAPKFLKKYF